MTITTENKDGELTLKIEGWLDYKGSQELGTIIDNITAATKLVLDFSDVEYMSSAGIRQVVAANRTAKTLEATFSVINVNPDVMSIFEMTHLNEKMPIIAKEA
ncbi:MAG: STAS domain-containing protein [Synergistaceae bacterium]|nr:STAS domain-containing protein [Synergistaceae bacterium]